MSADAPSAPTGPWPALPSDRWADTLERLHLASQIIGKVRMAHSPWLNHSWSVPLYVATSGLRTSLVPYGPGDRAVELSLDLRDHQVRIDATNGEARTLPLDEGTVADLYQGVREAMASLGMPVRIDPTPSEIPEGTRLDRDTRALPYDPDHADALWRALLRVGAALGRFRAGFLGKASPVHLFWGSFDLATTRFSGRAAPAHPGGVPNLPDDITREAYSHEVTSAGFWPGNRQAPDPVLYAYAYPTPEGYAEAAVEPAEATWLDDLGEFALPYAALTRIEDPEGTVAAFLASAHAAAADLAGWDRGALECAAPLGPDWWTDRRGST